MTNRINFKKLLRILAFFFILFFTFWFLILLLIFGTRVLSFEINETVDSIIYFLIYYVFPFVFLGLICFSWTFVNLAISIWVYKDARKLNLDNPIFLAILSFIFCPIFIVIYYIKIRKTFNT